jgi:hypothetical protein
MLNAKCRVSIVMLSVAMLNVVMLSVAASFLMVSGQQKKKGSSFDRLMKHFIARKSTKTQQIR